MRSKCILLIVMMAIIGCDNANGGGKDNSTTPNITNRVIKPEDKEPKRNTGGAFEKYKPVELNLSDLTFEQAFEIEHRAKGEGHTFWWNGEEYTTDMYISVGDYQWVRNSDDLDDNCRTNRFDECGVCNGPGMITWYRDHDNDGLGDPKWFVKDCIYPSVDEE